MQLRAALARIQVHFVVGKGGVGKSTVTAALALAAARSGLRVLVVELEGRPDLPACFGDPTPLTFAPRTLVDLPSGGRVEARRITPDDALVEWLREHGFRRLVPRLVTSGALEIIATAVPGIRDVLILGKIKALTREGADIILVDAPATGHSVSLLASPAALVAAARSGPIRRQAEEVDALVRDGARCAVLLVTLAEDLPVTEAVQSAFDLEDRAGVALSAVVVNRFDDAPELLRLPLSMSERASLSTVLGTELERARAFTLALADERRAQRDRLALELPLPQVVAPTVATTDDVVDVGALADALSTQEWP